MLLPNRNRVVTGRPRGLVSSDSAPRVVAEQRGTGISGQRSGPRVSVAASFKKTTIVDLRPANVRA